MSKKPVAYPQLIKTIRQEIQSGLRNIKQAVLQQRVITYWNVGKHIVNYLQLTYGEVVYGPDLKNLSKDLSMSVDVLRKAVQFYQTYPKLPKDIQLSWSQYRSLLAAPDDQRLRIEKRAIKEGWGSEKIIDHIKLIKKDSSVIDVSIDQPKLSVSRGKLYCYKTIQDQEISLSKGNILVDCGFGIRRAVKSTAKSLNGGHIVKSYKNKDGSYHVSYSSYKKQDLFTYVAQLDRVVDGDTLILLIDLGFDTWMDVRVRLRGIDAPELPTAKGRRAKQWVVDQLAKCHHLVVKTYKEDKYGRYLVDIFYLPKQKDPSAVAKDGICLNQEMLGLGLAKKY